MTNADDRPVDDRSADAHPADPVRERRRQLAHLAKTGKRLGYSLFGLAIVLFFVGLAVNYSGALVAVIVAALVAGSMVLAPAIILGYAAKAAEREDRARGW